jgi:branched-chain amino acid transport system ATP-binding protein
MTSHLAGASPLEVAHVSKRFGGYEAVRDVSFRVEPGSITGLIGPNGAGKTTMFNLIAGSLPPSAGRIALGSRRLDGGPPHRVARLGVGRTFQIPRPFLEMTVLENVMLARQGQRGERVFPNWLEPGRVGAEERATRERARALLEFVGLSRWVADPARVLSGGQRKLLELARVLMAEPRLVLLDEPAAGVAPALLQTIVSRIAELNRQGITFLIIEHNMDVVSELCRPILVMAGGVLLAEGDPDAVRADPRVIEAYLGGPGGPRA